jgi:hypothetical protein
MKKIILAALFLISGKCFSQTTVDTFSFKQPLKFTQLNAKSGEVSLPDASPTSSGAMTAAQVANLGIVTADVTKVKTDLTALTNTVNNLPTVGGHKSKSINTSTYTLSASDNNSTLFVYTGAQILVPQLSAGFKCTVVRMGNSRPTFSWSGISFNYRANFTPLASRYLACDIIFETNTNAVLR